MALPTLTKTWQFNNAGLGNLAITAQGTPKLDNARVLRSIKDALIAFGTNPWVMRYSCNSVTAGSAGDGVDRLTTDANFVWAGAGAIHSWMVLRQTGIAANYEICISCENISTGGTTLTLVVSPSAAFTGGSTTARPTATDEIALLSGAGWTNLLTDVASRLTVAQSTDGQCTRVIGAASGVQSFCWLFEKPGNPTTGWSNPSYSFAVSGATTTAAMNLYNGKMRSGSTNGNVAMGCESLGSANFPTEATIGNIVNEISNEWPMLPIGIACNTVGIRGRHGTIQDLWMGSASVATGDTYPNDASNQFAQFGILIFPWSGGGVNLT